MRIEKDIYKSLEEKYSIKEDTKKSSRLNESYVDIELNEGRPPEKKLTEEEVKIIDKALEDAGFDKYVIDTYGIDTDLNNELEIAKVVRSCGFDCRLDSKSLTKELNRPTRFINFKKPKRDIKEEYKEIPDELNESLEEGLEKDYSDIPEVKSINYSNEKLNLLPGVVDMKAFIKALEEVGEPIFKVRTTRFPLSLEDVKDEQMVFNKAGWSIGRSWDSSLSGFNEVYICKKTTKNENLEEGKKDFGKLNQAIEKARKEIPKMMTEDINNIDQDEILCYDFYEYPGGNPYICIMYKDAEYDDCWDLYADVTINTDYDIGPDEIILNNDLNIHSRKEVIEDLVAEDLGEKIFEYSSAKAAWGMQRANLYKLRPDWKEFITEQQKEVGYNKQMFAESLDIRTKDVDTILDQAYSKLNNKNENLKEDHENLEEGVKKMSEPKKYKGWDPDEHIKKVCKYYRDWAGFGEDEVLTEDLLKNEDWRLKRVSALKNVPVRKIKEELLKQKDSDENK